MPEGCGHGTIGQCARCDTSKETRELMRLQQEARRLRDALEEIALAGMSGTGMESEEGMRDWHARQAWKFIGIAARALKPDNAPQPQLVPGEAIRRPGLVCGRCGCPDLMVEGD